MTRIVDGETLVKPAKFAHFVLRVRDLERSINWYETVLGMEMVHRADFIAFMTYDDEHHRLALAETPVKDDVPQGAAGLDHVAYTLTSLEDLLATYKRLKAHDILPVDRFRRVTRIPIEVDHLRLGIEQGGQSAAAAADFQNAPQGLVRRHPVNGTHLLAIEQPERQGIDEGIPGQEVRQHGLIGSCRRHGRAAVSSPMRTRRAASQSPDA